jgi:Arc/MetJ family transcription regulator
MMAVDIDPDLREEFKRAARSRLGSVRAAVEGMVRAYLEGEIPGELILKYSSGPRWRARN